MPATTLRRIILKKFPYGSFKYAGGGSANFVGENTAKEFYYGKQKVLVGNAGNGAGIRFEFGWVRGNTGAVILLQVGGCFRGKLRSN
jgi:hypothetical protein